MGTLLSDATGEVILNTLKSLIEEFKDKQTWKTLFVETGKFFIQDVDHSFQLLDDMVAIMSKDNMVELAKKVDFKNGYTLQEKLRYELTMLMKRYEVPHDQAEMYIRHFMLVIIKHIEERRPEQYQQIYLNEWKEQENRELEIIKKRVDEVLQALKVIESKHLEIYSTDQMELNLLKSTINPSIGLDFFGIDDEVFQLEFEERIQEKNIYITGKCREEAIYCVLNELRRRRDQRVVLVVKSQSDWEGLQLCDIKDAVLIPWFYASEITAIPDNTNIFIYGEDEYCIGKDSLTIRKRTKHTIIKKLEEAGMPLEKAYQLVEDTHGLYVPMKKKIFNGLYCKKPDWVNEDRKILLAVLLCGKWTEAEGDKVVLSQLAHCSYENMMDILQKHMLGEDPFVLRIRHYGKILYQLASVENAWDYLSQHLNMDGTVWQEFENILYEILIESDPIFEYPSKEHFYRSAESREVFWSPALKQGMLRSLIMRAYYVGDKRSKSSIDSVITRIMAEIDTTQKWLYISQYFLDFCEASPEVVLNKLEKEWEQPTGLWGVFSDDGGDAMFGRHYYTNILWGVEQFLLQEQYAVRAAKWLLQVDNLSIKYPISNSPRSILTDVFCPWVQISALDTKKKIALAEEAIWLDKNAWDILYNEFPGRKTTMMGRLNPPKYREAVETLSVSTHEFYQTYSSYIRICLDNMDFSNDRWEKIWNEADNFRDELLALTYNKFAVEMQSMDDFEKMKIKNALRLKIHRHRFFTGEAWTISEQGMQCLEKAMNSIHMSDPVYDFQYLFVSSHDFPLLHPAPFQSDGADERNEAAKEEEIKKGLQEFKAADYKVERLIKLCAEETYTPLGIYLAQYYCMNSFDEEIFMLLVGEPNYRMALDYVRYLYRTDTEVLHKAVNIAKQLTCGDDVLVALYGLEIVRKGFLPLISAETEDIKRKYWSRGHMYEKNEEIIDWQLGECRKYGTQSAFIQLLDDAVGVCTPDEILEYLLEMRQMDAGNPDTLTSHYLKQILVVVQDAFIDTERCSDVAEVEIFYRGILEWSNMKCTRRELQKSPSLYAQMASVIYLREGQKKEQSSEEQHELVGHVFQLFNEAHFCPAEKDGTVNERDLREWVMALKCLLEEQRQERLLGHLLGRVLANSPIGDDDCYPCEAVRKIIEEVGDESLQSSYITTIYNKRGMFSPTAGRAERELAEEYKNNANRLRLMTPKTAAIYDCLSEMYFSEAEREREEAENAEY